MVDVRPFLGIRYNAQLLEGLTPAMSPPYDVINEEMQEDLYQRSSYNVIRLILGRDKSTDDEYNNKYVRAANFFQTWRRDGILVEDEKESLYFYQQIFTTPDGRQSQRIGWIGLVKLEDLQKGKVMAHEYTFEGPKADRLNLLRTTKCNLSPIFTFYTDQDDKTEEIYMKDIKKKPWQEMVDDDDVVHRLWVVSRKNTIKHFVDTMKNRPLYIADGHHRYETALKYRDEMRECTGKKDGKQPFDYIMMYVTSASKENLVLLPTHRVLSAEFSSGVTLEEVLDDLDEHFNISRFTTPMNDPEAAQKLIQQKLLQGKDKFGVICMLLPNGSSFLLCLKENIELDDVIDSEIALEIKQLDVTLLHHLVITQIWIGNPDIELEEEDIFYVKDISSALKLLKTKKGSVAFFLNPINMKQFAKIVSKGLRMPHKSTYFYPKLLSGFVMRDLTSSP